eukprot:1159666-Pelagomonas_calceolata.AAC.4
MMGARVPGVTRFKQLYPEHPPHSFMPDIPPVAPPVAPHPFPYCCSLREGALTLQWIACQVTQRREQKVAVPSLDQFVSQLHLHTSNQCNAACNVIGHWAALSISMSAIDCMNEECRAHAPGSCPSASTPTMDCTHGMH